MDKKYIRRYSIAQVMESVGIPNPLGDLHITAGITVDIDSAALPPFRSGYFLVLLILEGKAETKIDLLEYTLTQNSVLITPPGSLHNFVYSSPDCRVAFILFSQEYLNRISLHVKNLHLTDVLTAQVKPFFEIDAGQAEAILLLFKFLQAKAVQKNPRLYDAHVFENIFVGLLYELCGLYRIQHDKAPVTGLRSEMLTFHFLKLLSKHYLSERNVGAYADMLHISAKYLSRVVKSTTGKTPGYFIHEKVVLEAKILLDNVQLSIAEIAGQLNFSNPFFFSIFFKRYVGENPSEYRKKQSRGA